MDYLTKEQRAYLDSCPRIPQVDGIISPNNESDEWYVNLMLRLFKDSKMASTIRDLQLVKTATINAFIRQKKAEELTPNQSSGRSIAFQVARDQMYETFYDTYSGITYWDYQKMYAFARLYNAGVIIEKNRLDDLVGYMFEKYSENFRTSNPKPNYLLLRKRALAEAIKYFTTLASADAFGEITKSEQKNS